MSVPRFLSIAPLARKVGSQALRGGWADTNGGFHADDHPGAPGIQIGVLARVHQVVSSHVTRLINRCISNKWVHVEKQGRITTVFLTRKGMQKEAEARSAWKKLRLEYEGILGREEVKLLADRLAPAVRGLESARQ